MSSRLIHCIGLFAATMQEHALTTRAAIPSPSLNPNASRSSLATHPSQRVGQHPLVRFSASRGSPGAFSIVVLREREREKHETNEGAIGVASELLDECGAWRERDVIALGRQSERLDWLLREFVRGSKAGRPRGRLERRSFFGQDVWFGLV